MPRYVEAVQGAEIISEKMNIPLADLVDVFADIPTADVVPKSEVEALKEKLDATIAGQETLQKALVNAKGEVARKIFEGIDEALQYAIDLEDKYGRYAWEQSDMSGFHIHEYAEDKLETIKIALSLFKKQYTEGQNDT